MDYRCVTQCDATASGFSYAFLYTGSGITHESWGPYYPVCVKDCFYTPKQFYYLNGGVKTCDTFPKAGYYQVLTNNLLDSTACTLYKADDRRCTSTCTVLNTEKNFTPYGLGFSVPLLSAQNSHLHRNDPECVPSCQGLSPAKLTYTDSNGDVSCTTSCPPSTRRPSGSHLSVQDGTNCQNTCTTVATPVFELQGGTNKMCITSCRSSAESTPNHFQTTTPTGYEPPGHSYCVSDCLSSNGLGYTFFKAVGTLGGGLIECIPACAATGSETYAYKLLHSA